MRPLRRRTWCLVALGALSSCHEGGGTTTTANAPFASLCDAREPVKLLPLGGTQMLANGGVRRYGDSLVFVIEDAAAPEVTSVRATGPCGQGARTLFEGAGALPIVHRFEQPVICDAQGRALLLALDGAPATVLFEGTGCDVWPTGTGAIGMRPGETGEAYELVFRASIADDARTETIATQIRGPSALDGAPVAIASNEVFFVTLDDELVALEPTSSGVPIVLAEDVGGFGVSADGRFVLWQTLEPFTKGVASHPIYLLDRKHDQIIDLGWGRIGATASIGEGFAAAHADPGLGGARIVLLPELRPLLLGEGRWPLARTFNDWLVLRDDRPLLSRRGLAVFDLRTDVEAWMFDYATSFAQLDEGLDVIVRPNGVEAELWHWSPHAPSAAARFVALVEAGHRRVSPRQIVLLESTGRLMLFDENEGEQYLVDHDAWLGVRTGAGEMPLGPGTVIYEVVSGERKGLWAARFRPSTSASAATCAPPVGPPSAAAMTVHGRRADDW